MSPRMERRIKFDVNLFMVAEGSRVSVFVSRGRLECLRQDERPVGAGNLDDAQEVVPRPVKAATCSSQNGRVLVMRQRLLSARRNGSRLASEPRGLLLA